MNGNMLQPTEFHSVAWDARSDVVIGGAQDTGTPEHITSGNPRFRSVSTSDGDVVAVDDLTTPGLSTRYSASFNLFMFRRRVYNAANVFISQVLPALTPLGGAPAVNPQFYTPLMTNRVTPTRLVLGAVNGVYESFDQGDTVRRLTPVVVANSNSHTIVYGAAGNPDVLYVGANNQVFVRTVAPPAAMVASATHPGGFVLGIAVNPNVAAEAYVVDATRVFRTTDSGATWTNLTGNLMTLNPGRIRSVAFSTATADGAVVVGADRGVFVARGCSAFSAWQRLGTGLPKRARVPARIRRAGPHSARRHPWPRGLDAFVRQRDRHSTGSDPRCPRVRRSRRSPASGGRHRTPDVVHEIDHSSTGSARGPGIP